MKKSQLLLLSTVTSDQRTQNELINHQIDGASIVDVTIVIVTLSHHEENKWTDEMITPPLG